MKLNKVLVTGSSGLVGSEATRFFLDLGSKVYGIDNDGRADYFGQQGSTWAIVESLSKNLNYQHFNTSVTDAHAMKGIIAETLPEAIIHCAGQPSHEFSSLKPHLDFSVNALGTVNLLSAVQKYCPESPFIFVSTNKVYGDRPNQLPVQELQTRFEFASSKDQQGISEEMSLDQCLHSPFGASKASADLMVQEFGLYYDMPTACFRCGCITGQNQRGVQLHGFLNYLCYCANTNESYTINGHKGKQVRDNIHAFDLVSAFYEFIKKPASGKVYNMGGGKDNSCSILEAIKLVNDLSGKQISYKHVDASRKGDHICYYTNFSKFKNDFPNWNITRKLPDILLEML